MTGLRELEFAPRFGDPPEFAEPLQFGFAWFYEMMPVCANIAEYPAQGDLVEVFVSSGSVRHPGMCSKVADESETREKPRDGQAD